jgi:CheY-like chemotaxis protein/anti-sigma regulatory factor (Ser/Thr protein kinase)
MSNRLEELREYTHTLSILFADDADDIRELYHFYFDDLFANVYEASDGDEALEIFKANQYSVDLILTDQFMPNMNGLEMIKEVRKLNSKIPIILITSTQEAGDLIEAINLQVSNFIQKPINFESVLEAIEKSIHNVVVEELKQKTRDQELEILKYKNAYSNFQQEKAFTKQLNIIKNDLYKKRIDLAEDKYLLVDLVYKPKDILSGDTYSIHHYDNNKLFFFIIDAMGKGISASVSSFISTSFINYYFDKHKNNFNLRKMLETYIDFIRFELLEDEIVSAVFGIFDIENEQLSIANFSMPTVLGVNNNGEIEKLSTTNIPITSYTDSFNINEIDTSSIKKFILYSDGLTENITKNGLQYINFIQEDFKNSATKKEFLSFFNQKVVEQDDDTTLLYFEKLFIKDCKLETFSYKTALKNIDTAFEDFSSILSNFEVGLVETMRLEAGFTEMIMNAYEHGNLGINFDRKQQLLEDGEYHDFINEEEKNHQDKNIMIQYYIVNGMLILNIQDEGKGFDTNILKELFIKDNEAMFHGRGVKISSSDFDFVVYNDIGNSVLFGKKLNKKS